MKKFYEIFNYDSSNIAIAEFSDESANWYDLYDTYIPQKNIPSYFILDGGEETDLLCSDMGWRIFSKELKSVFEEHNAEFNYLPVKVKGSSKDYYVAYYKEDYDKNILNSSSTIWCSFRKKWSSETSY